ncbi:hypothetical protein [Mesorhizobium sp.]|uniref:hypothetical protein n=1 Tax=Mesorhizobium sp. TaxID=1871066 RepID=UPI000FE9ECE1|nr:hypothetical protein [Mesorhizobium sp.]RWP94734.1 MAG: hypothetical protein EOR89_28725 [Mesorhizobium sp.]RWQ45849.1 MAG: hypothetical protein EOS82_23530 [Mesorhizobium sp.]
MADAVLQSGLNYRTVVRPRVARIQINYPDAAKLSGVKAIIEEGLVCDFLLWTHPVKVSRFTRLAGLLSIGNIEDTDALRQWLKHRSARNHLLSLHGVGPKTYDYMCCLVGIDRIAVDRHIKTFAREAGVSVCGYNDLQAIVSYAADLLGLPRRDFDAWIWSHLSQGSSAPYQYKLL